MKFDVTRTTERKGVKTVITIQADDLSIHAISVLQDNLEQAGIIPPPPLWPRSKRFLRGILTNPVKPAIQQRV
jgi:hypothetical protein